jgi:hypothetical protein
MTRQLRAMCAHTAAAAAAAAAAACVRRRRERARAACARSARCGGGGGGGGVRTALRQRRRGTAAARTAAQRAQRAAHGLTDACAFRSARADRSSLVAAPIADVAIYVPLSKSNTFSLRPAAPRSALPAPRPHAARTQAAGTCACRGARRSRAPRAWARRHNAHWWGTAFFAFSRGVRARDARASRGGAAAMDVPRLPAVDLSVDNSFRHFLMQQTLLLGRSCCVARHAKHNAGGDAGDKPAGSAAPAPAASRSGCLTWTPTEPAAARVRRPPSRDLSPTMRSSAALAPPAAVAPAAAPPPPPAAAPPPAPAPAAAPPLPRAPPPLRAAPFPPLPYSHRAAPGAPPPPRYASSDELPPEACTPRGTRVPPAPPRPPRLPPASALFGDAVADGGRADGCGL